METRLFRWVGARVYGRDGCPFAVEPEKYDCVQFKASDGHCPGIAHGQLTLGHFPGLNPNRTSPRPPSLSPVGAAGVGVMVRVRRHRWCGCWWECRAARHRCHCCGSSHVASSPLLPPTPPSTTTATATRSDADETAAPAERRRINKTMRRVFEIAAARDATDHRCNSTN